MTAPGGKPGILSLHGSNGVVTVAGSSRLVPDRERAGSNARE
jgi:hypothetical protein